VVMYVMSASQTVFGAVAANACFSRFGAIGRSWRLSVVQAIRYTCSPVQKGLVFRPKGSIGVDGRRCAERA
jgi:hypothetical protein